MASDRWGSGRAAAGGAGGAGADRVGAAKLSRLGGGGGEGFELKEPKLCFGGAAGVGLLSERALAGPESSASATAAIARMEGRRLAGVIAQSRG